MEIIIYVSTAALSVGIIVSTIRKKLVRRYRGQILGIMRIFYIPGGDRTDLYQWGLIGLYKAILQFDAKKR